MESATVLALSIPLLLTLIWIMGKLSLVQRLVKIAVVVGVGYLLVTLIASLYAPELAQQLTEPLKHIPELLEQLWRLVQQLVDQFRGIR